MTAASLRIISLLLVIIFFLVVQIEGLLHSPPLAASVMMITRSSRSVRATRKPSGSHATTALQYATSQLDQFFNLKGFLIVGASTDRAKFGNKVLRSMVNHKKACVCINKRVPEIEGIPAYVDVQSALDGVKQRVPEILTPAAVGVNFITPPLATAIIMQEAYALGIRHFFCQPGTLDKDVRAVISSLNGAIVIEDCVLVQLDGGHD